MRALLILAACLAACSDAAAPPASDPPRAAPPRSAARAARPHSPAPQRAGAQPPRSPDVGPVPAPTAPERGMRLFATHCAVCHGERGRGDGPAAPHLEPRPWSFEGAFFKWGTTATASSSDADILRVLRRGVPGTSMPPHAELSDDDLCELVAAVRFLALTTTAERIHATDPERSEDDALKCAMDLVRPGRAATIPPRPAGAPSVATDAPPEGFERRCRECHGIDGTGRGATELNAKDAMLRPIVPRDLTCDVLRGGETETDIATRLARGIAGTPMPAANLPAASFWEVVDYVRRLRANVDPEAAVQRRTTVSARRVAALPTSPSDAAWAGAPAARLPLSPLRIGADVPAAAEVRALGDGRRVAFRIQWRGRGGDAAAGAAVRLLADAPAASPFAVDAPGVVARWSAGGAFKSAASPPKYVPLSEVAATAAGACATGERVPHGWAVVLDVGLPESVKLDVAVGVWDGVAADGRLFEGTTIRHALDAGR